MGKTDVFKTASNWGKAANKTKCIMDQMSWEWTAAFEYDNSNGWWATSF